MEPAGPGDTAGLLERWRAAVGEEVAAAVSPLGVDGRGRLRVVCRTRAWQRQVEVLQAVLVARMNREPPGVAVTGIAVETTSPR